MDQAWSERGAEQFNGSLLAYQKHELNGNGLRLEGRFIEYRFYYAQKRGGVNLGLEPIGVSGLIICEDHLIFARRAPHVTAYPNHLELVPSGGIDRTAALADGRVDFLAQLRLEFAEETNCSPAQISSLRPLAFVHDLADSCYDIACEIRYEASLASLLAGLGRSAEYQAPVAVPIAEAAAWVAENAEALLPTSKAIVSLWLKATS